MGCTLFARMINHFQHHKPKVHIRFSSVQGPFVTPLYEDRLFFESVKYQGMIYSIYGNSQYHRNFLALRYVEDGGYCAYVRHDVTERILPSLGHHYFAVDGQRGRVADIIKDELNRFITMHMQDDNYEIIIDDCYMPWSRMFEVGLKAHVNEVSNQA